MPAPIVPIIILGLGAVAALALGGKKKGAPSSGTFTLDHNLPASTEQQVLGAIANVKDPAQLLQMATEMAKEGYPLAGNALRMRAAELTPGAPLPDVQGLDGNMDPATRAAVLQALATESDPNKLMTFAGTIQLQYPIAAGLLVAKANALGGGKPMGNVPQPGIPSANAPDVAPQAAPPGAPALPPPVFVAPMAPPPDAIIGGPVYPGGPPGGLSVQAYIEFALAHPDQAAQMVMRGLIPAPASQYVMPPLQAEPSLDNVLPPPRPAPVPMPPPNPGPLGPPAPPPAGTTWILATNADVARDGTQARYMSLLKSSPVGTEVHETYNNHLWKLRVISHTTDPGLTTYAKDVKGWVAAPSSVVVPSAAPPPAYVPPSPVAVAPVQSVPMVQQASYVPTVQLSGVQQAAVDMANALTTHGYKQADQGLYKAFQSATGGTADGFPGLGTMGKLDSVLASAGLPPPAVKRYPWHSMPGTSGYNGVNAPTWAEWSGPVTTSGHGRRIWH
jgi:hypothetical protein